MSLPRRSPLRLSSCALIACTALCPAAAQDSRTSVGSGKKYRTIVERQREGELSAEDTRQASVLASRLVAHVDKAARALRGDQPMTARPELVQAQTLANFLRELLPVTVVTTVVMNARGEEVYRGSERVQEDLIPLDSRAGNPRVVDPILDPEKEGAVGGTRLSSPDAFQEPAFLDLSWMEPRLKRAVELIESNRDAALAHLILAQAGGIRTAGVVDMHPLLEAEIALRTAELLVDEKRFEAARMNLRAALARLGLYGARSGGAHAGVLGELEEEITRAASAVEREGAADRIHASARRVMDLIEATSGRARGAGRAKR